MRTNGEAKFSFLLIGLGLGAVGGLIAALLARKDTRDMLRETTEGIVKKGKDLMSHRCCSDDASTATHKEDGEATLGG